MDFGDKKIQQFSPPFKNGPINDANFVSRMSIKNSFTNESIGPGFYLVNADDSGLYNNETKNQISAEIGRNLKEHPQKTTETSDFSPQKT